MYDFAITVAATMIFVVPILIIVLIVGTIAGKSFKRLPYILIVAAMCFWVSSVIGVFNVPEDMVSEMPTTTEQVETTAKTQEPTTEKATIPPTTTKKAVTTTAPVTEKATKLQVDTMVSQFITLGFTQAEAQEMKKVFATVGITEIHNIRYAIGSGIDNLQSFTCDIYDYHADRGGVSLHFTIDKRQLCFISLNGIPTTKTDYAYINIFGNVKFKTSNAKKSVILYDIWDEDGEIIPGAIGYKAVFDYENKKITNYEE